MAGKPSPKRKPERPGINTAWFVKKLEERGISQRQLAKLMKLNPSSLHHAFNGRRKMQTDEAMEIARIVDVPFHEVLRNAGVKLPAAVTTGERREVRIVGWVDSAGNADINWGGGGDAVDAPPDVPAGTVAIQVRAAGATFTTMDGWLLFTVTPADSVNPEAIGRLALCRVKGGAFTVGHVKRGYKRGSHTVVAPGGAVLSDVDLEFATPISWIRTA